VSGVGQQQRVRCWLPQGAKKQEDGVRVGTRGGLLCRRLRRLDRSPAAMPERQKEVQRHKSSGLLRRGVRLAKVRQWPLD
jgi:hypothetical protein